VVRGCVVVVSGNVDIEVCEAVVAAVALELIAVEIEGRDFSGERGGEDMDADEDVVRVEEAEETEREGDEGVGGGDRVTEGGVEVAMVRVVVSVLGQGWNR